MALVNQADLQQYAKSKYNVLLTGHAGVGKTAIVQQVFEHMGYKWLYFSAATLDPWVDLIGVPKAKEMENGEAELVLVRPSFILRDDIDAIFFDELNRAPTKVLNAVMELIQFKSINGHKLNNLKVIWAAINPWDEEGTYAVDELDPAIMDRFQIQISVPYKVDEDWFISKYPDTGKVFCNWWKSLEAETKLLISPRRLDYAADAHSKGLKLSDILSAKANIKKLKNDLASIPFMKKVECIKTEDDAKAFLAQVNNVTELLDLVKEQNPAAVKFLDKHKHHVSKEIIAAVAPAIKASSKKLNHEPTAHAFMALFNSMPDAPAHTFGIVAREVFTDSLFQVELMADRGFNFFNVLVEELKLYKAASKAASARVFKLTTQAMVYLNSNPSDFEQHGNILIGLLGAIIVVDQGEQFTKERSDYIAKRLVPAGVKRNVIVSILNRSKVSL